MVKVSTNDFKKVLALAGESTLIDLVVGGKSEGKVLIKDNQYHPVNDNIIHVDFYEVDMSKEINAEIPLHFVGESKAVKEAGGALIRSINEIEVKCLPTALVNHIDVDISMLKTFDDVIKIHDLVLPAGIKLAHDTDDVVANIANRKPRKCLKLLRLSKKQPRLLLITLKLRKPRLRKPPARSPVKKKTNAGLATEYFISCQRELFGVKYL